MAFTLDDRYTEEHGRVALTGVQALVRIPLDQHRIDARQGLRTATLISGYRGSPLGGYDFLLQGHAKLLEQHDVKFLPGVNEDLGATAVFGAQLANLYPNPKYDGVLGIWYGKGPGVDRSGDAFKHANLTGVGRNGGVLAVAGDDPASKSSTVPSASEFALYDAQMPVLSPADVQDVLDLGLKGFALSRYSGLWVGLKITTNVADEFSSVEVGTDRFTIDRPKWEFQGRAWRPTQSHTLFAPYNLLLEQELIDGRLEAARRFAAANDLNRIEVNPEPASLGIVASGKTYFDVREALTRLGFDEGELRHRGIRILRLGLIYPLEPEIVRRFARGLEEIVVVEEKRPWLELLVRDALYAGAERPRVIGKQDETGRPFVPGYGELDADLLAGLLLERLQSRMPADRVARCRERVAAASAAATAFEPLGPTAQRLAYFCSGCPHNRSTVVPDGSLAAVGIGCHGMAVTMERSGAGFTQMGGEGAQWVGAAPFTNTPHLFQNLGDGTFFHSGSLAVRQAIAANTNITFKILYNGAVAMTGGQHVDGGIPVPALTRELAAEGVRKIIVLTDELERYRGVSLAEGALLWPRERLDEAQRALRETAGVTVLIYDQHCAADLRRRRKRGLAPERPERVLINERICEGCGDCGVKSNCLSVQPVETEFGRKTQIHQSSCNTDYSCLEGDCPSFVTVVPDQSARAGRNRPALSLGGDWPEPAKPVGPANLYLMGIGGTGVVTVNQILGIAAVLEGKSIRALDQTGLSQKGGAVVSHLKIFPGPTPAANKIGVGEADAYLGFDVLTAADVKHLSRARPDRTVAVISSSHIPTGLMVRNPAVDFPADSALHRRIDRATRAAANRYFDAERLAEHLFGSHLPSNLIVVGAAYQMGLVPLAAENIERAIELNGAAVGTNVQAFRAGRRLVAEPDWVSTLGVTRDGEVPLAEPALDPGAAAIVDGIGASGELARLVRIRVPDLIQYQNPGYAAGYADLVARAHQAERALGPRTDFSQAVARYWYQLLAYKDEYEVARLALDPGFQDGAARAFGPHARLRYRFHPPALRSLGLTRKLSLGRWFELPLRMLRALKGLRGTWLDPFGRHPIRRLERELIAEYRRLIETEIAGLSPETYDRAVQLARLPELIRGYESVKLANVERYRAAIAELTVPKEPRAPVRTAAPV